MTKTRDLANLIADSKVGPTEIDTSGTYTLGGIAATGDLTLDVAGDIILDADDAQVIFKDAGTTIGGFNNSSSNLNIFAHVQDKDITFTGDDNGLTITALTLDMSEGGRANFNNDIGLNDGRVLRLGNGDDTSIYNDGSHFNIVNTTANHDIMLKGNDDGSPITALTLDMSNAGAATFNSGATFGGNLLVGKTTIATGTAGVALRSNGEVRGTVSGAEAARFSRLSSDGSIVGFEKDGASVGSINVVASEITIGSNDAFLWTSGNNNAFLPASTTTGGASNGLLDLGSTGRRFKDLHLSGTANSYRMKVSTASSGASADASADELVVESNGNAGISILSGQSYNGSIYFGDAGVNYDGFITYGQGTRSMSFGTAAGTRMTLDSSGNLGIAKASLNTWSSGYNALQVGGRGFVGAHTGSDLYLGQNASFNSGWKYEQSVAASMTQHSGGKITHFVAPAGTAGNAISWNTAMDITAEGTTTLAGTYSSTNSVNYVLRLQSSSSGSAVAGHGTGIQFLGERNDGNVQSLALIQAVTLTNSGTSIAAGLHFYTGSGGAPSERMSITSAGQFVMPGVYNDTTSDAANINVRSDGLHRRSTSSLRYKNTINDATHGLTELLALRPVTYKGNNDGDTVFGGLIAEEVHDVGLTEFVDYDSQNRPNALRYSHMISLCVKALQEQQEIIESLTARITALEA